jgi:hypothetical protein
MLERSGSARDFIIGASGESRADPHQLNRSRQDQRSSHRTLRQKIGQAL